ncbi:MAG: hypothetical protein WCG85_09285 [Polyangia bacterium]
MILADYFCKLFILQDTRLTNMDQPVDTKSDAPKKGNGTTEDLQLLRALGSMFGVLPQLGGAALGIVTIGYFIGWKSASSYYGAFGAEWITSLLSPSELLQQSYTVLSGIVSGILATMLVAVNGAWRWIQGADIVTSLVGTVLLFVALGLDGCMRMSSSAHFAIAASFLLSFSLSSAIVLHAYAIRDKDRQVISGALQLGYFLWFFAAYQIPTLSGKPRGQLAADPDTSTLAVVTVGGEDWRLLLARSDRLVLAKIEKGKQRIIRIVPVEKVDRIQARLSSKQGSNTTDSHPAVITDAGIDVR